MAKWTVTLTVFASCIFSVLSQTDFSSSPALAASADTARDEVPTDSVQPNTSSFPPLIHGTEPEEDSTSDSIGLSIGDRKQETAGPGQHIVISTETVTEVIIINPNATAKTNSSTATEKPNSSNILQGSLLAITVGVLVCKFGF